MEAPLFFVPLVPLVPLVPPFPPSRTPQQFPLPYQDFTLLAPAGELLPFPLHHFRGSTGDELLVAQLPLLRLHQTNEPFDLAPQPAALPVDIDGLTQGNEYGAAVGEHGMPTDPLTGLAEGEVRELGEPEHRRSLLFEGVGDRTTGAGDVGADRLSGRHAVLCSDSADGSNQLLHQSELQQRLSVVGPGVGAGPGCGGYRGGRRPPGEPPPERLSNEWHDRMQ